MTDTARSFQFSPADQKDDYIAGLRKTIKEQTKLIESLRGQIDAHHRGVYAPWKGAGIHD